MYYIYQGIILSHLLPLTSLNEGFYMKFKLAPIQNPKTAKNNTSSVTASENDGCSNFDAFNLIMTAILHRTTLKRFAIFSQVVLQVNKLGKELFITHSLKFNYKNKLKKTIFIFSLFRKKNVTIKCFVVYSL